MKTRLISVSAIAGLVALGVLAWPDPHIGAAPKGAALAAPSTTVSDPVGEVVLSFSGPNSKGELLDIKFDLAALQAMPVTKFQTTTMWTEGAHSFQGVEIKTLLDELAVTSGTLLATAINDYRIEIPVAEIAAGGPIIAYLMDGMPMSVRDKGPLWVVYPYDSDPQYQSEVVFSRSIWQLNRLEIRP